MRNHLTRTSDPSKIGNASEILLSPGVAGLVGLLSTWSNSTRVVTPGLNPKMDCCAMIEGFEIEEMTATVSTVHKLVLCRIIDPGTSGKNNADLMLVMMGYECELGQLQKVRAR